MDTYENEPHIDVSEDPPKEEPVAALPSTEPEDTVTPAPEAPEVTEEPAPSTAPEAPEVTEEAVPSAAPPAPAEAVPVPQSAPSFPGQPYPAPQKPKPKSPFADHPYAAPNYMQPPAAKQGIPKNYVYQPPVPPQPGAQSASKGTGKKVAKTILASTLVIALVAGSCGITALRINSHWKKQNELLSLSLNDKIDALEQQIQENENVSSGNSVSGSPNTGVEGGQTPAQVYAQNVGSVVAIECSRQDTTQGFVAQSSGSGFVLTEDGYIVSNYHVVEDATALNVVFSDGAEYPATFIGGDASNDISLLKIEATGLRPVTLGRSDQLIVGDQVVAIGNPLGELASTLTVGFLSAKDRVITTEDSQINMMQTDAAINPGNSGGPLFNMKGEVVGITTAKYSGTTASGATIEGIGFAIPIDDVRGMISDLRLYGYVTGAYLGVTVSNVDPSDADRFGLPMGVLVHDVTPGSCAKEGGIRKQDIITSLGGYEIKNMNDLTRALRRFKADDEISVTVYRHSAGGEQLLSVKLDEKPHPAETEPSGSAEDWFDHFFG